MKTLPLFVAVLLVSSIAWADSSKAPKPTSQPGGKSISTDVHTTEVPGEPVGVKPLNQPEAPGTSSANMGPGRQSSMGAGVQLHFGKDAKKPPKHKSSDEEQSDEEDEIMDRK